MIGHSFRSAPVQRLLETADHATLRLISPIDGVERLAATRLLQEFPLSIIATSTVAASLTDWREQTRLLVASAGLTALVIAITLSLIVKKLRKQHQESERQLGAEKERLDTAINKIIWLRGYSCTILKQDSYCAINAIWKCSGYHRKL
jgi:hypothetical protein